MARQEGTVEADAGQAAIDATGTRAGRRRRIISRWRAIVYACMCRAFP